VAWAGARGGAAQPLPSDCFAEHAIGTRTSGSPSPTAFVDPQAVIQDGSSFALRKPLRNVFPERFTTIEPPAHGASPRSVK